MYYRLIFLLAIIHNVLGDNSDFDPSVSANCERGYMNINVLTKSAYTGIVHTRDYRNNSLCSVTGNGSRNTTLRINIFSLRGDKEFCGVTGNQEDGEQRQVAVAVRQHRNIEINDDKYFLITCGQSSYFNAARKTRARIRLQILHPEDPSKIPPPTRLIMGNAYTLRAQFSEPDKDHRLFLKHCIAFSQLNSTETLLIDGHGCPADSSIISPFNYSRPIGEPVDAAIKSMFKFPEVYRVHIQCDAVLCKQSTAAKCARKYSCPSREPRLNHLHEEDDHHRIDDGFGSEDETTTTESNQDEIHIVATTTVYVLEPDQDLLEFVKRAEECNEWRFPWLIGLCAVLGALLGIMLLVNICLCTSLSCTCAKQDVLEKEDNSELADYDPYRIDWTANNSHMYGNSLPRHYHAHYNGDYQEELDYNNSLGHQRPSSRYSSSAPSYNKPVTGYHNYGYR